MSRDTRTARVLRARRRLTMLRRYGPRTVVSALHPRMARRLALIGRTRASPPTAEPPLWRPPGHFYSPVTSPTEVDRDSARIWARPVPAGLPGIDLRLDAQVDTLKSLARFHAELPPYRPEPIDGFRFRTENRMYGLADAGVLYAFLRDRAPRRVIEVGSGFSSAVILDTDEHFLDEPPVITFIEPHPERLHAVLRPGDGDRAEIIEARVQDVDVARFRDLGAGDILVVDSSHVAKTGSDVNFLFFEVLPLLAPGVLVHVHDIAFPFEYPRSWVDEGRSWNEAYLLRAFLSFNERFRIELWNSCLRAHRPDAFASCPNFCGGSQIWVSAVPEP